MSEKLGRKRVKIVKVHDESAYANSGLEGMTVIADVGDWQDGWYALEGMTNKDGSLIENEFGNKVTQIFSAKLDLLVGESERKEALAKKSKGNQAFSVPNTDEGREFLRLAEKFFNKNKYTRRNRTRGAYDGIPLDECNWIGIYITPKDELKPSQWMDRAHKAERLLRDAESERDVALAELAEIKEALRKLLD